jgi:hypothetical protein
MKEATRMIPHTIFTNSHDFQADFWGLTGQGPGEFRIISHIQSE